VRRKSPLSAFLSLLLLSIPLVSSFVVQAQADSTWSMQTVDENGDGIGLSMALDSKDNPHLCYIDYVNGYYRNPTYLTYASWNGASWNTQVVDLITEIQYPGFLSFDSNNNPHISYIIGVKYGDEFLMYATWTGTSWGTQTVASSHVINLGSMVLDSSGNPCIGYYGNYHGVHYIASIMFAKRNTILSLNQILLIALFISLLLAIAIAVIVKKRMEVRERER
jgi:hypothetical protein